MLASLSRNCLSCTVGARNSTSDLPDSSLAAKDQEVMRKAERHRARQSAVFRTGEDGCLDHSVISYTLRPEFLQMESALAETLFGVATLPMCALS